MSERFDAGANTRFYSALINGLRDHGEFRIDAFYLRVDSGKVQIDDYMGCTLDPPISGETAHREALNVGRAWISIQGKDAKYLPTYNMGRPRELALSGHGGLVLPNLYEELGEEPVPDQPYVWASLGKIVVPNPLEDPALKEIYDEVVAL